MNIEKIEINGHYVWVDNDSDVNENDFILTKDNRVIEVSYLLSKDLEQSSKIIAASPELNLEGVPTYVEWLAKQNYPVCDVWNEEQSLIRKLAFIKGYQTAEKELQKEIDTAKIKGIEYACIILEGLLETGVNPNYNLSDLLRLKTNLIDKGKARKNKNIQPTWDDVRKAIELDRQRWIKEHEVFEIDSIHKIIEQLKQDKK